MSIKTCKKGSAEKLSANFRVSEFACHGGGCCDTVLIDEKLVEYLQKIRDHFGAAVTITSGYRCEKHNKAVGGVTGSLHRKGMAADIVVKGIAPAEVAKFAESIGVLGIGLYETNKDGYFVHIDTREKKGFWYGQGQAYRSTFGGEPEPDRKTYAMQLPRLEKGCKGDDVRAFQQLLIANGYNCGPWGADGDFGENTKTALIYFQTEHDLAGDGIVGPATCKKILGLEK